MMLLFFAFIFGFSSAEECKNCHSDIYKEWVNSLHASSFTDPVFVESFRKIKEPKVRKRCYSCHKPTRKFMEEGITCDYCHSIKKIERKNGNFIYILGKKNVKRGPLVPEEKLQGIGHRNAFSKLHLHSDFCKGCHQFQNNQGINILNTYNEWRESSYSEEGIHCQNCHMPEVPDAEIVNPEIHNSDKPVTAHRFLGGHSQINLQNAAKINLIPDIEENKLSLSVYITNAESGHKLPTGIPTRKIVLEVKLIDKEGNIFDIKRKVYQRLIVDKSGKEVVDIGDLFYREVYEREDNRISPKETRREFFNFKLPETRKFFSVQTELFYEFRVPYLEPNVMRVRMQEASLIIDIGETGKERVILFSIIIVFGLGVIFLIGILFKNLIMGRR